MARTAKPKQKAPHAFVVDALMPLNPEVRRMFSGFAVYLGDRIVCMLRDHPKSPKDNGVWLVLSENTSPTDPGLRREFPSLHEKHMEGREPPAQDRGLRESLFCSRNLQIIADIEPRVPFLPCAFHGGKG